MPAKSIEVSQTLLNALRALRYLKERTHDSPINRLTLKTKCTNAAIKDLNFFIVISLILTWTLGLISSWSCACTAFPRRGGVTISSPGHGPGVQGCLGEIWPQGREASTPSSPFSGWPVWPTASMFRPDPLQSLPASFAPPPARTPHSGLLFSPRIHDSFWKD